SGCSAWGSTSSRSAQPHQPQHPPLKRTDPRQRDGTTVLQTTVRRHHTDVHQGSSAMFIATAIVSAVLALMLTLSAIMKLRHNSQVVESIHEMVGVPLSWFPVLAAL